MQFDKKNEKIDSNLIHKFKIIENREIKMNSKEFRKLIRKCKTESEIQNLFKTYIDRYVIFVRRRNIFEPIECCNSIFISKNRVQILLPPAWSCSFKDIKLFSYNIKIDRRKQ